MGVLPFSRFERPRLESHHHQPLGAPGIKSSQIPALAGLGRKVEQRVRGWPWPWSLSLMGSAGATGALCAISLWPWGITCSNMLPGTKMFPISGPCMQELLNRSDPCLGSVFPPEEWAAFPAPSLRSSEHSKSIQALPGEQPPLTLLHQPDSVSPTRVQILAM